MLELKIIQPLTLNILPRINITNTAPKKRIRKYTLSVFLERAKEVHGSKYDYSLVREEYIKNNNSKVPVKCNDCSYQWNVFIHHHIHSKSGCPDCSGNVQWTLDRFLAKAKEINGSKYDYSAVHNGHIHGKNSKLPVKCNNYQYRWDVSIFSHITMKSGCPDCSGKAPWTLERFLAKAKEIHGNKYNYFKVNNEDIRNNKSKVSVKCNDCQHCWDVSIHNHINCESQCPHCCKRKAYSNKQITWLDSIMLSENISIQYALSPEGEYEIPTVGKVDGYCLETNTVYEYHGKFWHGHPDKHNPEDVNPISGKTYGELYAKTIERDQRIQDLGYNLIVKWEE